jgi:hypothetical protein
VAAASVGSTEEEVQRERRSASEEGYGTAGPAAGPGGEVEERFGRRRSKRGENRRAAGRRVSIIMWVLSTGRWRARAIRAEGVGDVKAVVGCREGEKG